MRMAGWSSGLPLGCALILLSGLGLAGSAGPTGSPRTVPVAVVDSRAGWTVTADSEELVGEDGRAANVLDGDPATTWHTRWKDGAAALPHVLTIDMQQVRAVTGLTYRPRPAATGRNGVVGQYRVEVSTDLAAWTVAVSGTLPDTSATKTVSFAETAARYVRLVALTEAGGRGPWASAAEIDLVLASVTTATPSPAATTPVPVPTASGLPGRALWTATADSEELVGEDGRAANVLDGDPATIWHTRWQDAQDVLPHTLTIDTQALRAVAGLTYQPRPAGGGRNGAIGQYRVEGSVDGVAWTALASGGFADTSAIKTVGFPVVAVRWVRLVGLSEAGGRGPWSSAAEVDLVTSTSTATATPTPSPAATTPVPAPTASGPPGRALWTATADSEELVGEDGRAANVLDGDPATIWHTRWQGGAAPLPHTLTIDTGSPLTMSGLTYLPRPGPSGNGRIGRYRVELSADGSSWEAVASGLLADTADLKTITFASATARYVRLTALSEAAGRGPWTSAAELNLVTGAVATPLTGTGSWSSRINLPLVPVAAAVLPNGKVLTWSSDAINRDSGEQGLTQTATLDPASGEVTASTVTATGHDMFCPGIAMLADGRVLVNGGSASEKTSLYDAGTDTWSAGAPLLVPRGYQSAVTLSDGGVFTLGGSWSGGLGGKDGEVWTATGGSRPLPGAPVAPILTNDPEGIFRSDNHPWLFAWSAGRVFHAGPSRAMGWYGTTGQGSYAPAGVRNDDQDAMNGNAVMYDVGKILTVGGAPSYDDGIATDHAYAIDINGAQPTVTTLAPMARARVFANSVVLPDGKVLVVGGQAFGKPYSDATAAMEPELWDPATRSFTTLAPMQVPRNYHSVALLMPDGRVLAGGGGLCAGCGTDHADAEIFTPPYLLDAQGAPRPRPAITWAPGTASAGGTLDVATDKPVTGFSLVRTSSATHSVNTDQRRIPLQVSRSTGTVYTLSLPDDRGVLVPGYYMLFALDADGVPSIASTLRVG